MTWWIRFKQALYPPVFRIPAHDDAGAADLLCLLEDLSERLDRELAPLLLRPQAPAPELPPDAGPSPGERGLGKEFAIDLGNQLLRLNRSIQKIQQQGGAEAARLKGHYDRMTRTLEEHTVKVEDLTGQVYDPGRVDFDPLGEPQVVPGLARQTIIQCERPVVYLNGKLIQAAKGIVGKPE